MWLPLRSSRVLVQVSDPGDRPAVSRAHPPGLIVTFSRLSPARMAGAFGPSLPPSSVRLGEELLLKLVRPFGQQCGTRGCRVRDAQPETALLLPLAKPDKPALIVRLQLNHQLNRARTLQIAEHRLQHLAHEPIGHRHTLRSPGPRSRSDLQPNPRVVSRPRIVHHYIQPTVTRSSQSSRIQHRVVARAAASSLAEQHWSGFRFARNVGLRSSQTTDLGADGHAPSFESAVASSPDPRPSGTSAQARPAGVRAAAGISWPVERRSRSNRRVLVSNGRS